MSYLPSNVANGLLKLDSSGKAPVSQLPTVTLVLADTDPGQNNLVTAGGTFGRDVFGSCTWTDSAVTSQHKNFRVETGIGTGVYTTVADSGANSNAAAVAVTRWNSFAFFCPTGRRYGYVDQNGAVTLKVWSYKEW